MKVTHEPTKDVINSVQIKCFANSDQGLKLSKSVGLNENLEFCVALDAGVSYSIKAELNEPLAQVMKLVPIERKVNVVDSAVDGVDFEQLEARLDGRIVFLPGQSAPSDFSVQIKASDPKRVWSRVLELTCDQSEPISCTFSLTNLLFGDYLLSTNYDDLFCWKENSKMSSILINVNAESQNVLIEHNGYAMNFQMSHKSALIKVLDLDERVLLSKNVQTEADLRQSFCLPEAKRYAIHIDSCYKYTDQEEDFIEIGVGLLKKGENKISLQATKTQLVVDVVFKADEAIGMTGDEMSVEVNSKGQLLGLVKFTSRSELNNEVTFSGKIWVAPNQLVQLVAKSSQVLFETKAKELTISETNCKANHVQFEAKLGVFIQGTVSPSNVDGIDLTIKIGEQIIFQDIFSASNGFKVGPLKAPHSQYSVELSKSGYLFHKTSTGHLISKDTLQTEFNAEKLGQLKVNVVNSALKANLENVLLSLSSENRLFRQTLKTDSNGLASFDNLRPGLYYLIMMMQEYSFEPNSHPIQISDGHHLSLAVEAKRVAFSCLGKVGSINGQAQKGLEIKAVAVSDNDENCSGSEEHAQVDDLLGSFRLFNLKPGCEYEVSVVEKNEPLIIVPASHRILVNDAEINDVNFVVLDKVSTVDVSLAVSFKSNIAKANHFVKVKMFKTSEPDSVLQTLFAPASSMVYFNALPRQSAQHYSVQVSLLAPTTFTASASLTNQQQSQLNQQPVLETTELGFYADAAHKHLVVNFDKDNSKNFSFDFKQQQYQNVYFTLPLAILLIGLLLNSTKVQQSLLGFKAYVDQRGGFVKFLQGTNVPVVVTTKSNRMSYVQQQMQPKPVVQPKRDSSSNISDVEKPKHIAKTAPVQIPEPVVKIDDPNESDYYIVGNEVPDIQVAPPARRKVKKVD